MRNKIVTCIVGFLIASSNQADAKPVKKPISYTNNPSIQKVEAGGLISGKQYLVLVAGARVIPDNGIYYIPCNSIDCDATYSAIQLNYSTFNDKWNNYRNTRSSIVKRLGDCAVSSNFDACEKEMRQKLSNLGSAPSTGDGYLEFKFQDLSKISSLTRTDFDGNYAIDCPTAKCLVFSTGLAGNVKGYWVQLVSSNSKLDLANSTLIHDFNISESR